MSFDLINLQNRIAASGPVIRLVVARTEGSTPREVGASMLVWATGQEGTIGGGTLEYEAVARARAMLESSTNRQLHRLPLGPALGQCCGGAVMLLSEMFDEEYVKGVENKAVFARPTEAGAEAGSAMPLLVSRLLGRARSQGITPAPALVNGWLIEPVQTPPAPLWIYGAGHVGRALVSVITPMPEFVITWVDTGPERFPAALAPGITPLPAAQPHLAASHAPTDAHHLILTYSHALDLELCHALLNHGFSSAGLIGSASKWARFRTRLAALGHSDSALSRISCPIGDTSLGKHPHAIAVGVAASLLKIVAEQQASNRGLPCDSDERAG